MADEQSSDTSPQPRHIAETPPPAYPRTVMDTWMFENVALIQNSIGKLSANVEALGKEADRLSKKVEGFEEKIGDKVGDVDKNLLKLGTALRTTLAVLGIVLPLFGVVFWWAIRDRIESAVKANTPPAASQATPPPSAPARR